MSNQGGPQQSSIGGNILIDQSGDRIVITNPQDNTSLILGILPDGVFGVEYLDNTVTIIRRSSILHDLYYDKVNGVNIVEAGKLTAGGYGLRVAKPGIEVTTATASQLIFNSAQDALKVVGVLTPSLSFTIPDTGAHQYSVTTAHGLSFKPAYIAYADLLSGTAGARTLVPSQEYSPAAYSTLIPSIVKEIWVDATNVVIQLSTLGITGAKSYNFTVYLLQETAN